MSARINIEKLKTIEKDGHLYLLGLRKAIEASWPCPPFGIKDIAIYIFEGRNVVNLGQKFIGHFKGYDITRLKEGLTVNVSYNAQDKFDVYHESMELVLNGNEILAKG